MRIKPAVVRGLRCVRKMRGGAQAHLIEASNGCQYVVKFVNNPQGRRILVNEMVASFLFGELGINVAQPAFVTIDRECLKQNPNLFLKLGSRRIDVDSGVHFGSLVPCEPAVPIFDFLPDALFQKVVNRDHFKGVLMADKWVCNCDGRQAVFHRAGNDWVATMIDQGYAFEGTNWRFTDAPLHGLYGRVAVYGYRPIMRQFELWIEKLFALNTELEDEIRDTIPTEWLGGEENELRKLLRKLFERRELVPDLVRQSLCRLRRKAREDRARVESVPAQDTIPVCISVPK